MGLRTRDTDIVDCLAELFSTDDPISGGDLIDALGWITEHRDDPHVNVRAMFEYYTLLPVREEE